MVREGGVRVMVRYSVKHHRVLQQHTIELTHMETTPRDCFPYSRERKEPPLFSVSTALGGHF